MADRKPQFSIDPGGSDKAITILGPGDLRIEVDYDDVDHGLVDDQVEYLLELLNNRWNFQ